MYCKPEDLVARFGANELLQVLKTPPPLDAADAKLLAACVDAKALCDGYLVRAVSLPLAAGTPAFSLLVALSADVARYRLHDDQVREGGEVGKTAIRLRYEDALKTLEQIASGKLKLNTSQSALTLPTDTALPLKTSGKMAVVASPTVFTQARLDKVI